MLKSHYAACKKTTSEVWGLAYFINEIDNFVTCGDDATLRLWSFRKHQQIKMVRTVLDAHGQETAFDHKTNEIPDSCKGRSVAVTSDGEFIIVGF